MKTQCNLRNVLILQIPLPLLQETNGSSKCGSIPKKVDGYKKENRKFFKEKKLYCENR